MKKTILFLLLLCSLSVSAAPYLGAEYNFPIMSKENVFKFETGDPELVPVKEDAHLDFYMGYQITDVWGVELGYSQFSMEDLQSKYLGQQLISGVAYREYLDWDSKVKAQQISLAPVYRFNLTEKFKLNFKMGLTYTKYENESNKSNRKDAVLSSLHDNLPSEMLYSNSGEFSEIGLLTSIGVDYFIFNNFALGTNVKYHQDSYMHTANVNVSASYHF